MKHITQDAQAT